MAKKSKTKKPAASPSASELDRLVGKGGIEVAARPIDTRLVHVIGIVANTRKPKAVRLSRRLGAWFQQDLKKEVLSFPGTRVDALVAASDFIVTVGGDGTLLGLARYMTERPVPVFGVNTGRLGFLTAARPDQAQTALAGLFGGETIPIENRLMLSARVVRKGHYRDETFQALNDIVINREGLTRYLKVEISIGEETFSHFFGDGVIVATPTGSTAYSMSAGGPVLVPTLNDIIITAICPHASALRSMVVPSDQIVHIRVFSDRKTDRVLLTADGGTNFELEYGDVVECTRAPLSLPLVKCPPRKYFSVLRDKFKIPLESNKRR